MVSGVHTSEHHLDPAVLADLAKDMLLTDGRGYFFYTAWKDSSAPDAQLPWRMKASNVLPAEEVLGDRTYLSTIYPFTKDRGID